MKERVRAMVKMRHTVSPDGQGKWHSKRGLRRYKLQRRRLNNIAEESRKRNWN